MLFKNSEQIIRNGKNAEFREIRSEILDILTSAIFAVDSYNSVKTIIYNKKIVFNSEMIDLKEFNNIFLIGFGKASIGMANAVSDSIKIKKGAIITNEKDKNVTNNNISTFVGSHPIPSEKNINATDELIKIVKNCKKDDLLIVLISGGGSSLLCKPRVNINDLQNVTNLLLRSGADIKEINTIRKHISYVKGGQLASYCKCKIVSLIISDIIKDPIEFIASGPTYPDSTTYLDAQKIFNKYNLWMKIPSAVQKIINDGIKSKISETPKKSDSSINNVLNFIVANNTIACNAAEEKAEELGYKTMIITTNLDGDAKERGIYLVDKALNFQTHAKKMIFISGGETTVNVKGKGNGGRNQEMVLSSVEKISNNNFVFTSFATDGIDGSSNSAGAIADSFTLERAKELKLDPMSYLNDNNSNEFFKNLKDSFKTGPTGTNVMDIQLLIKLR
jgi:hydroxypyruvate reductase/glycerate 2-kinase